MTLEGNFVTVFNSITNESEFGIKEFIEMYTIVVKEFPGVSMKKKIQFMLIDTIGNETVAVQMKKGTKPYIFKKTMDTAMDVTTMRLENYLKYVKKYYKNKKRIRSMEKAPNIQTPESIGSRQKFAWGITKTDLQIIQQKFEVSYKTIQTLKKEKTRLIDEVQQLTSELRANKGYDLKSPDLTFLNKEI